MTLWICGKCKKKNYTSLCHCMYCGTIRYKKLLRDNDDKLLKYMMNRSEMNSIERK